MTTVFPGTRRRSGDLPQVVGDCRWHSPRTSACRSWTPKAAVPANPGRSVTGYECPFMVHNDSCAGSPTRTGVSPVRLLGGRPARLPAGYATWLTDLKVRIRETRLRAALAVNSELISLYWQIGRDIRERQAAHGWGAKVVNRLAADLHAEFPEFTRFLIGQFALYAGLRRGVARSGNSPTGRWQIALGPEHRTAGGQGPGRPPLVHQKPPSNTAGAARFLRPRLTQRRTPARARR